MAIPQLKAWRNYKSCPSFGSDKLSNKRSDKLFNKTEMGICWDFPGGPVAKTPCSQFRGLGSTPGQGTTSHMPQ